MALPYQCLHRCGNGPVLVAASASRIDSFSLDDGSLLSTWDSFSLQSRQVEENNGNNVEATPPAKRRKLSDARECAEAITATTASDHPSSKKLNYRANAVLSGLEAPAVIALASTKAGTHVIAVTGEDKSIRVFRHDGRGCLFQLSQRAMPKRPCAIAITDDGFTIISADKFGDVYSMPLIIPDKPSNGTHSPLDNDHKTSVPAVRLFTPAANDLTVHSVRNRKALENQKRQTNRPTEKLEPVFEHTLLLGHVSMLTDIALTTLEGRTFIITADRDEHIRVSRGIPQTHIVEGFCLGHTEFVSRICVVESHPQILISGGGDDALFVWNWTSGYLLSKADIKIHLEHGADPDNRTMSQTKRTTVSGLYQIRPLPAEGMDDTIVVICEGVAALFVFSLTSQHELLFRQRCILPGNPLCVATSPANGAGIIVSIDTIHKPGSTSDYRGTTEDIPDPLIHFTLDGGNLVQSTILFAIPIHEKEQTVQWTSLLYNTENLRKRDGGLPDDE